MKVSVESLLEPISPDNPCGDPIEYDPQYIELESLLRGKQETQFAAAEEPDWKTISEVSLELFQRSKDLRVALRLALALLKTKGLPGFRDGIALIKGMVERYWEPLYPRLDPDDNNDPLERVNILASLATPVATFGDPFQFLSRLRQAPLSDSTPMGVIRLVDVERSISGTTVEGETAITASQIQGAFRGTPPDKFKLVYDAILESQVAVKELDQLLTSAVGAGKAVSFDSLGKVLKELQKALSPYAESSGGAEASSDSENESAESSGGGQRSESEGQGISGSIRNRQDVIRVLDQICEYFKRAEPSSPVPLLLQRARRLVDLDFMELLTDLSPESMNQIKVIAGIRDGEQNQ